ncbi:MAG: hypothetical protein IJL78_01545 [Lachnospiraceae bacterium]|nr:hypothetical protein [Lachnospiraceae bacterium]
MSENHVQEKIRNAPQINRNRCILSVVFSALICICVFLGIENIMLGEPTELIQEVGEKSFRMFTVLSNMLMAAAAAMCIPFAVDGLRYRNYHLPRWVVYLLYTATVCVTITFVVAGVALSSFAGFRYIMIYREGKYLHTIVPIAAILLFLVINTDHTIPFRVTFLSLTPMFIYAVNYVILAFVIGEEAGGWRDHYQFNTYVPWYLTAVVMFALAFGIAVLLRVVHNRMHGKRKADAEAYFREAPEFDKPTIEEAIEALAGYERDRDLGGDLAVPRRIVDILEKKYESGLSQAELLKIYLETYLNTEKKENENE